jgi:hypothetical protein
MAQTLFNICGVAVRAPMRNTNNLTSKEERERERERAREREMGSDHEKSLNKTNNACELACLHIHVLMHV